MARGDVRNIKNEVFSALTLTDDAENDDDKQTEILFTQGGE